MREIDRISKVYAEKYKINFSNWESWIYHPRHPIGHLFRQHNETVVLRAFNSLKIDVCDKRILDVGCGYGNWLRMFVEWGVSPHNLVGIDILNWRGTFAKRANPAINIVVGNGAELPFADESFDIVMQSVVFSSVLDGKMRRTMATEMARCLRPSGYLLWVDLRPLKSDNLVGFSEQEVKSLFKEFVVSYKQLVQPSYFRRLAVRMPGLCQLLYDITKLDCEAYLIILRKTE